MLLPMSNKELTRLQTVIAISEGRLSQVKAAAVLAVTTRQIRRLLRAYEAQGAVALASKKRGQPSKHQLSKSMKADALSLVRDKYPDFGPTFAAEKLREVHGIKVTKETLRKWMTAEALWQPRTRKRRVVHQPRQRRSCIGELVQIDGSLHHWFKDRGPRCVLLVFIDDATSKLMALRFVRTESAFDYFDATKQYLVDHGKPVAFYSDKHTIFRAANSTRAAAEGGQTQFGRALDLLNIEIICANTPQAKGRVEPANRTLQDRLIKKMRLRAIDTMEAGNAYLPEFMRTHNARFAINDAALQNVHRPLLSTETLDDIFTWQDERKVSHNPVVHYRNCKYHITPEPNLPHLADKRCEVFEWADGRIELRIDNTTLPFSVFEKRQQVQAKIVGNKCLGPALALIQVKQLERDRLRLASKKHTKRQKDRILTAE
jgi:transposase